MQNFKRFRLGIGVLMALLLLGLASDSLQRITLRLSGVSQSPVPFPTLVVPTSNPDPTSTANPTPSPTHIPPTVFLILMENQNWSAISGNPNAPYLNGTLLPQSSYARSYYNPPGLHPSEPNYLWLEAGTNFGILNDGDPASNHQATSMHLVTFLDHAKISWKSYQESISGNECPLVSRGLYGAKHNPMVFFDDVTDTNNPQSVTCKAHMRPLTELASDLEKNTVATYNFITPNICNDMHDSCSPLYNPVKQGDDWLAKLIPLLLNSQAYKNGGAIFLTWDEGAGGDGPIGMMVLSSYAKGKGYSNTLHYTHSSMLRTLEELFDVTPLLGDAADAVDLADLFVSFPFSASPRVRNRGASIALADRCSS
jgi:hypothetical protein